MSKSIAKASQPGRNVLESVKTTRNPKRGHPSTADTEIETGAKISSTMSLFDLIVYVL